MGEFIDKAKGTANEAMGKAKVAVAKYTDSPDLAASGAKQQVKGAAQQATGTIKGAMGDKY